MNIREWFEQGREQERTHVKKAQQRARTRSTRNVKPSFFSPATIIIGAGVLYEIARPYVSPVVGIYSRGFARTYAGHIKPVIDVAITDLHMLTAKIRKINPDWEAYKRFEDLARGKR